MSRSQTGRGERLPINRRSSVFAPWFDDMDPTKILTDFLGGRDLLSPFAGDSRFLMPAIDIEETTDKYVIRADLPGVNKEDINIEFSGNQLTISAERKQEHADGGRQDRREIFYGMYQRSFTLPAGVDGDKIEASYDNGVLVVNVPKEEQSKAKRIEIGERPQQSAQTQSNQTQSSAKH